MKNNEVKIMREDWIETRLDDIFDIVTGNTPPKKIAGNYGNVIPFIKPPEINNNTITTATDSLSEMGKKNARILPINSVLVTCIGNLGRVGINKYEVAFNQQINALKPVNNISSRYTFYQAQSVSFRNSLEKLSTSTTVALVNKSNFSTINYKLAPFSIQRAIVSKIESLFSDLDNGIANLTKAQVQLKIYRQAVLKKAFEGELTKEWREKQTNLPSANDLLEEIKEERKNHYSQQIEDWKKAVIEWEKKDKEEKKPIKPKKIKPLQPLTNNEIEELPILPKEWMWFKTGSICQKIQIGPFGTQLHKHDYKDLGIPIINPKHIKNQRIIPEIFISELKANSLTQYFLKTNDIILGRRGEMGRTALISVKQNNWFCGTGSLYIRLGNQFNGKLYSLVLSERRVVNYLNKKGSGTTMTNLNATIINELPIQLISLQEQNQIVQEIESRLSVCDKVEQTISDSLTKSKALRQSILKKAFEGKLLSKAEIEACKQEKDYEPASVLLEKIKNEKTKKAKENKQGKKRNS